MSDSTDAAAKAMMEFLIFNEGRTEAELDADFDATTSHLAELVAVKASFSGTIKIVNRMYRGMFPNIEQAKIDVYLQPMIDNIPEVNRLIEKCKQKLLHLTFAIGLLRATEANKIHKRDDSNDSTGGSGMPIS